MRLGERHEVPLNYARFENATHTNMHIYTHRFVSPPSVLSFVLDRYLPVQQWKHDSEWHSDCKCTPYLFLDPYLRCPDVSTEKRRSKTFPRSIRWKSELAFSLRGFPELRASRASPFRQISLSLSLSHTVDEKIFSFPT